ncbi:MAG TPA: PKD domain-containing protein [Gemmataceae bacterium]|jgi:PKD repeat protein
MIRRTMPALLSVLLILPAASAADLWHLPGWQARAVVEITKPSTEAGVDTAGIRILCQGRAKPDGSDYRVLDAAGKPVPFQLMFHDAERYSLLSFRVAAPQQRYFVYFGNPKAERAAEQVIASAAPGSGAPKGAWVPKYGFVLQTIQRPESDNPRTVAEMAKLIEGSKAKYGARFQRRVADGYNPFGPSDYYISIYRGWINVPKAGKYQFCTVSNEASFSFLDGKELIHWPGRHTVDRGARGEVNALVELTAGLHYLEYYHEEVTLEQMAYLGWRPSADAGAFSPIPESVYTAPHDAIATRYEDAKGALAVFEPVISDSVWPAERSEGQWTRCRFRAAKNAALPEGTTYEWDFGDGQKATGAKVEHIYLTLGTRKVTLTAKGPGVSSTTSWPLLIFEIEHVTDQFKEGRPKDYAKLARAYDRAKLDAAGLQELAYLLAESEQPADAVAASKDFLKRFEKSEPMRTARVRRLMADCALRLGEGSIDEAIANYQASLTKDTPAAEKLDVLARLIRLVGIERKMPDKAGTLLAQVEETAKNAPRLDDEERAAYRRAVIVAGDVLLWQSKREGARDLYVKAERLSKNPIPSQVRAARLGAYPNSLREYIGGGNFGAALDLVDRWDETFPTEKVKGHTFYWRGKILLLRGQPKDAERYLDMSVRLTVGADFESEERWLLAQALEQLGRKDEARKELAKLVATGLDDEFTRRAKEMLKK